MTEGARMSRFHVTFERTVTSTLTLVIYAENEQAARKKGEEIVTEPHRWQLTNIEIRIQNAQKEAMNARRTHS
jgi:hypothetical protein